MDDISHVLWEAQQDKTSPVFIDPKTGNGMSAVLYPCYLGHKALVQELLKDQIPEIARALVNQADSNGVTPILHAIKSKNSYLVSLLLPHISDLNARDKKGDGIWEYAILNYNIDSFNILVAAMGAEKAKTQLLANNSKLFLLACAESNLSIIQKMLEMGASLDSKDANGQTIWHKVAANPNGASILQYLASQVELGVFERAMYLKDNNGETLLFATVASGASLGIGYYAMQGVLPLAGFQAMGAYVGIGAGAAAMLCAILAGGRYALMTEDGKIGTGVKEAATGAALALGFSALSTAAGLLLIHYVELGAATIAVQCVISMAITAAIYPLLELATQQDQGSSLL